MPREIEPNTDPSINARREFLAKCGRLAVVTPPAVTLMLAASRRNFAVAQSGADRRDRDTDDESEDRFRNGGDRVPGRSLHDELNR